MSARTEIARITYPNATVFTRELSAAIDALTDEDFEIMQRQAFRPLYEEVVTPTRVSQRIEQEIIDDCETEFDERIPDRDTLAVLAFRSVSHLDRPVSI